MPITQFDLEQRAKRLEIRIGIALREYQFDEADRLNEELYLVHQVLYAMDYIAAAR